MQAPEQPPNKWPLDKDKIPIPPFYQPFQRFWDSLPQSTRVQAFQTHRREWEKTQNVTPRRIKHPASRFTTDYAIRWGRAKGWKVIDRERYDARTKRHHDLMLGADVMFMSDFGIVLVQGAGKYQRAIHRKRFEERGGRKALRNTNMRFAYVEFERGNTTPILIERWDLEE